MAAVTHEILPPDTNDRSLSDAYRQMVEFANQAYVHIAPDLEARREQIELLFTYNGVDIPSFAKDAHSCKSCISAVTNVPDHVLRPYNMTRSAGRVITYAPNGQILDTMDHGYFSHSTNPDLVLCFVPGQFFEQMGVSLDHIIAKFPDLFVGRALIGHKAIIRQKLGLEFPADNAPFLQYVLGKHPVNL